MAGGYRPDFNTGGIVVPKAGDVFLDFADRQNKLFNAGVDRNIQQNKLDIENQRFAREQELNKRQDTEYNRELGLRTSRQGMANEFLANPNAAKFGSGRETAELDKNVLDYVNSGGEINPEQAAQLQSRYEKARPFREDAINAITGNLVAAGEDPTKAAATASALGSNLLSRADMQTRADAMTAAQQKVYDEEMKAKLEAAKLNTDLSKTGAELKSKGDIAKYQVMMGKSGSGSGGSGGSSGNDGVVTPYTPGGNSLQVQQNLANLGIGWRDTSKMMDTYNAGLKSGYTPNQMYQAITNSVDIDAGGVLPSDQTVVGDRVKAYLANQKPGDLSIGGASISNPNLQGSYSGSDFVPKFAQRQMVDYDPKRFAEDSLKEMPWLNRNQVLNNGTVSGKDVAGSDVKNLIVDKYGDANFNKNTYDKNLSEVESGGNYNAYNASSKAFGKYQFVPSTINSLLKEDGSKHTIDEVRKSPELQDYYYNKLTKENIGTLKESGVPVNNFTVYMAHNLGPAQTANFFSTEPLTESTKKAIQAQGVEPTREAYVNRFMHKFEGMATPEEKRPTVQKEDVTSMTSAERKEYANRMFPELADKQESVKDLFNRVDTTTNTGKQFDSPVVQKRVLDSLNENNGGPLDELLLKRRLVTQDGLSEEEAKKAIDIGKSQSKDVTDSSNYNIIRRNYLTALREGSYQGKTAKEWEKEFYSTKYK